ncbi:uncharacterized protein LOC115427380 isoform X2 [Sphaeramia orbicularis]|uniref:Uncharacterized LOC115427380 n=1 Tax=Sphaeramia orbicularis TaxID=375764 RepID=A0A672ZR23_9TELE|nr:uncharacterized protein LOC115427380 isoform X2 [Sphaeramia orbicularis]
MIRGLAALILLNISALIQARDDAEQISWTVVKPGDNVTILSCSLPTREVGLFYWYKLRFGYLVQTVAMGTFENVRFQGQFKDSRFSATKVDTVFSLNIANVRKEDEATYYCQAGSTYEICFINGTILTVNDQRNQMSVHVKQHPATLSVELGESVTLQCSLLSDNKGKPIQCPGEHNVHWFRAGSGENRQGIIYTHKNTSIEQDKRKCVYRLSKTIKNSSESGTYYCAVATCGQILFGGGTEIKTELRLCPVFVALGLLVGCCVTVIIALILRRNHICQHRKGDIAASNPMGLEDTTVDSHGHYTGENHAAAVNYATLDFPSRRAKRSNITSEFPQDCVYSGLSG